MPSETPISTELTTPQWHYTDITCAELHTNRQIYTCTTVGTNSFTPWS